MYRMCRVVDISRFMQVCLLCIIHNAIYMGVPSYLSKELIIRTTTRPSRKCELIKLSVPLVATIYADAAFTVAAPKYRNSLPDDLRTQLYNGSNTAYTYRLFVLYNEYCIIYNLFNV